MPQRTANFDISIKETRFQDPIQEHKPFEEEVSVAVPVILVPRPHKAPGMGSVGTSSTVSELCKSHQRHFEEAFRPRTMSKTIALGRIWLFEASLCGEVSGVASWVLCLQTLRSRRHCDQERKV